MSPDVSLVILVGLGVIAFALKLYRKMLVCEGAELPLGSSEQSGLLEGLLARRLGAIDRCGKVLDSAILVFGTVVACAYANRAWLGRYGAYRRKNAITSLRFIHRTFTGNRP